MNQLFWYIEKIGIWVLLILLPISMVFGQTGKIAGRVVDAGTGEPLPGVNVILVGTQQGAATNANGYYSILNVGPGNYALRASYIGYAQTTVEQVNVNIDLTTTVNFQLESQAIAGQEVVIEAEQQIVRPDISANVANVSTQQMENLPVVSVDDVVGLEAGVEPGLAVRGSGQDEVNYMVDGMTQRDGRENNPFTSIAYTSVKEIKIQTGGFNAEYGNVRSGLVNIVTKEGPKNSYTGDLMLRYSPPQRDYFGNLPNHPDGFWMRPYVDDPDLPNDVDPAFVGTHSEESAWDKWTRRQYESFEGWNQVVKKLNEDGDPNNDFNVEQVQELFWWRHRKPLDVTKPDYEMDASFGGPVPFVSQSLGNLRFFASYRNEQRAYFIPQMRDAYLEDVARLKLTSNITDNMKLRLGGMSGAEHGIQPSGTGFPNMFKGEVPKYPWQGGGMVDHVAGGNSGGGAEVFANWTDNPSDVYRNFVGADLVHTLSSNTFYEVRLQRMFSDYNTYLPESAWRNRDSVATTIGGFPVDEAPYGYWMANMFTVGNMAVGGHWAKARDSSTVAVWSGRFDITSQINHFFQLKGGLEYIYNDYNINHEQKELFFTSSTAPKFKWNEEPRQAAAYLQSKLEFEQIVANLGLRLDYWDAATRWYDYQEYTNAFSAIIGKDQLDEALDKKPTEALTFLSPRLGVSFPVTANSKIYFNYGHFRQMLNPHQLFIVREINTGAVDRIGDPNHPMPRTINYELGFEQNLLNQYLIRISGYYKALDDQPRTVRYINLTGQVDYRRTEPLNYEDIRGVEFTLRKNTGRWFRGFANFTYMARKTGNFGFGEQWENRTQQREYERTTRSHYVNKLVPEPYGRFNLEFLTPMEFGPRFAGVHPIGDLHLSLLGEWRAGKAFTWTGEVEMLGVENNVRWRDYYNLDVRLMKNIQLGGTLRAQLFLDIYNIFNIKHLTMGDTFFGAGGYDWEYYIRSLHLPEDTFGGNESPYPMISGNDRPGDYRKAGAEFVPIEIVDNVESVGEPHTRPLYYEKSSGQYMVWSEDSWSQADQSRVDRVMEDKAYIDMPNLEYLRFLNPRTVKFGIRFSF